MKTQKTFSKGTDVNEIFIFVDDCLAGDNRLIEGDLYTTKIVNITIEKEERNDK